MITTRYVQVWMMAKRSMWRLRHPALTSEHLLYACLRMHDQLHWELCWDLPVTAETVWTHLKQNPPSEASEDFCGMQLGLSAKAALERAESEAAQNGHSMTGTKGLMRALLSESAGPVRSLLDANRVATPEVRHESAES